MSPLAITFTTVLGCAAAALVCVALAPWAFDRIYTLPAALQVPSLLGTYIAAALLVQATGLMAVRARYANEPGLDKGTRYIWLSMLGGALLSLSLTVSIAGAADFSTATGTILLEVLATLVCFTFSVYLGATWWLGSRGERGSVALH